MNGRHLPLMVVLLAGLIMALGSIVAHRIQTQGGEIIVSDLRFTGASGHAMSGLLHLPAEASADHPVPGILAVHGYINSRETQSAFAIELARRGYAVLALDQTGHGFSAPPAFSNGFGGPDGLAMLRSLPMVDSARIGLEGHSMGGWAVLSAAAAHPDDYRALALLGSGPGLFGAPDADRAFPRNLMVIFSAYDEFSDLMWQVPTGAAVTDSERLADIFGTEAPVTPGVLYGDPEDGSARLLRVPPVTHPGDHFSERVTAQVIDWFDRTLGGAESPAAEDQVWMGKEFATAVALLGLLLFLPALTVLGTEPAAAGTATSIAPSRLLPTALVPVLSYFPCFLAADVLLTPGGLWPQPITNGLMLWLLLNTAVNLAMHRRHWRLLVPRRQDRVPVCRALGALALGYAALTVVHHLWSLDWRLWVVALKPLAPWHWPILAAYLPVLLLGFAGIGLALHAGLGHDAGRPGAMVLRNAALLAGPFAGLLVLQYGALFAGAPLPLGQPLLTIVAIQFVPLLGFVAAASTLCFQAFGRLWPGAVLNAGLVGWLVVAGTATA